ncbi:MAG: hypothetical protein PVI75_04230, partial [Gammaproteobacteria bacterium]
MFKIKNKKQDTNDEVDKKYTINLLNNKKHSELYKTNEKTKFTDDWIYKPHPEPIEQSIHVFTEDIHRGMTLTIDGKKLSLKGLKGSYTIDDIENLYNSLCKLLKNKFKNQALKSKSENQALKEFKNFFDQNIKEDLKKKKETLKLKKPINDKELPQYARQLVTNFLTAQGIDINKKIEEVKTIIKSNSFTTNENYQNKDLLYKYVVFLANVIDTNNVINKSIKTL